MINYLINHKNEAGVIMLAILMGIIFYGVIKSNIAHPATTNLIYVSPPASNNMTDGYALPFNPNKATMLTDGWGNNYALDAKFESVEPRDPAAYMTGSMNVPIPYNMISSEKIKNNYLTKANLPYLHYDEDLLNRELLPPPKFLFVGP